MEGLNDVVGQTVHWISILICKVDGDIHTFLCDSRNLFCLGMSVDQIEEKVDARIKKRPNKTFVPVQ